MDRLNAARTAPVRWTSSASNDSPPRNVSTTRVDTTYTTTAAALVITRIVARFERVRRTNSKRSPEAATRDSTGNAATENATPIRLTGTLWKFRAKLTELTLPAMRVDATDVK